MERCSVPFPTTAFNNGWASFADAQKALDQLDQARALPLIISFCRDAKFNQLDSYLQTFSKIDERSFISTIESCLFYKRPHKAKEYLVMMREHSLKPTSSICSKVITALFSNEMKEQCRQVIEMMRSDEIPLDVHIQGILTQISL